MTSPELLRAVGEACYGRTWQAALADGLGVNPRTVRRWAAGDSEPTVGVWQELRGMIEQRHRELADAVERIIADRAT